MNAPSPRPIRILLANPRGFCAGVERAIQIVERALEKYGPPVYVRHEIVHNRYVVDGLKARGAIFVDELDAVPTDAPVIFSAHGVPKWVPAEAQRRELVYLDATCPLVSKVHMEAEKHFKAGHHIIMIGHEGHPEVIGTMGQLPAGAITLVEDESQAEAFAPQSPENLAFVTQTTLSVDDTADIVATLQRRFPQISSPHKEDICYATTNRQDAVKVIGEGCDLLLVIGAGSSSNSKRLVEVATRAGAKRSELIASEENIDWTWMEGVTTMGLTAGASAPEDLVQGVIDACKTRYNVSLESIRTTEEDVVFKLPRILAD